MKDHYNEILMQRWVKVFQEILEEESFLPIQVTVDKRLLHLRLLIVYQSEFRFRLPTCKSMKR